MNTKELISVLWDIRQKDSGVFRRKDIEYLDSSSNTKYATILSRESRMLVVDEKDLSFSQFAMLTYSDQNPLGYSNEASLVRQGYLKTNQVGWLYINYESIGMKVWLAKVVNGAVTVIRDCNYIKDQRKIWLRNVRPPKDGHYAAVPQSRVIL